MKRNLITVLLASLSLLSFASLAFAALPTEVQTLPEGPTSAAGILGILKTAANIIFTVLLVVAVVFVLLAAFQFITGGGNAEALEQARSKLIWATVGVGVALLAQAIPTVVRNILNVT